MKKMLPATKGIAILQTISFQKIKKNGSISHTKKLRNALLLCTGLLLQMAGFAQEPPVIQWEKLLGGSGFEGQQIRTPVVKTSDGGYVLAGYTTSPHDGDLSSSTHGASGFNGDFWIVKLDAGGNKQWDKVLGGTGDEEARAIRQTSDGGYIIVGHSWSSEEGDVTGINHTDGRDPFDAWIVKLDANGNKQWDKLIGGTGSDIAYDVQQTTDGYIIVGESFSSESGDVTGTNHGTADPAMPGSDYWIIKLGTDGTLMWNKLLGGTGLETAYAVSLTSDGGYIVSGSAAPYPTDTVGTFFSGGDVTGASHGGYDYWVVKLDAAGNKLWDKLLGGTGSETSYTGIQQTSDGGYIVSGMSTNSADGDVSDISNGDTDAWLVKLDASGNKVWDKLLGGSGTDFTFGLDQTSDGGYIVGGYTNSSASGDFSGTNHGIFDYWIIKVDASGNKEWDKLIGGSDVDVAEWIEETAPGEYILGGYTSSSASGDVSSTSHGDSDYWIVKLAPAGVLPVTLSAFNAVKKNDAALLTWTTASEQNNKGFTIERNANEGGWQTIGFTPSAASGGNSSQPLFYHFTDQSPVDGINQYRLKRTDYDGRSVYSSIATVQFESSERIVVSPNPLINGTTTIRGLKNGDHLQVFTQNGQFILDKKVTGTQFNLDLSGHAAGVYQLIITNGKERIVTRILKAK